MPAVAGMLSGHFLATLVVAAGVGSLAGHPLALTLLTLAGCSYLLWLGGNLLLSPAVPAAGQGAWGSRVALGVQGVLRERPEPKVFLLFLALLPQFTDPQSSWPVPLQILLLGLVHLASSLVIYSLVGYGAKAVLSTRPGRRSWSGGCRGGNDCSSLGTDCRANQLNSPVCDGFG
jgi:threonine/homoserine/homoserine lactone efflux protein